MTAVRSAFDPSIEQPTRSGALVGMAITHPDSSSIMIGAGHCYADDGVTLIQFIDPATVDIDSANGPNALDTGDIADASWYDLYALGPSGAALFVAHGGTPVLPAGHTVKRLLGTYYYVNGTEKIRAVATDGLGRTRRVRHISDAKGDLKVLDDASAAPSYTEVNCESLVPDNASTYEMLCAVRSGAGTSYMIPKGSLVDEHILTSISGMDGDWQHATVELDVLAGDAAVWYKASNPTGDVKARLNSYTMEL